MRPPLRRRHDAHHHRRRDFARQLPPLGYRDPGEDGQGPLPSRYGRSCRSLSGSSPPPRRHQRERAPARDRPGSRKVTLGRPLEEFWFKEEDMIKARVTVTLKNGVLDPQGKAI